MISEYIVIVIKKNKFNKSIKQKLPKGIRYFIWENDENCAIEFLYNSIYRQMLLDFINEIIQKCTFEDFKIIESKINLLDLDDYIGDLNVQYLINEDIYLPNYKIKEP